MTGQTPRHANCLSRYVAALLGLGLSSLGGGRATAQEQLGNFSKPIPVLGTGGHTAPVRGMAFTSDSSQLLSAGLDKVVHVWALNDGPPRLTRTLRPPIWRGMGGAIYALAVAPVDPKGSQLVAVAGYGVEVGRGDIFLMNLSARDAAATGRVEAHFHSGSPADANAPGHSSTVLGLAFSPDGRVLASCGLDGTARLWDVAGRKLTATLRHPSGAVHALAFSPGGRRLATGAVGGILRVWDVGRPAALPVEARGDPSTERINTLAWSPDGRWVVAGRENGKLVRFDAASLAPAALPTAPETGAVKAVAISPDSRTLAVSLAARRPASAGALPPDDGVVELRAMPGGALISRSPVSGDLAYALAFSPDGKTLAYSGGSDQAIHLKSLAAPAQPEVVLKGTGTTIRDVGFRRDGLAIGYDLVPRVPNAPLARVWGFDLRARSAVGLDLAALARALPTYDGWSLTPVDDVTLTAAHRDGRRLTLTLDRRTDVRWHSWSFIPPGPGHPSLTLAVGGVSGTSIFRLDTGSRVRLLTGHGGPVTCLAPSPDGRWLATGSSDQTVRLWKLAGTDAVGPLGAAFVPGPGGLPEVRSIAPRGFAQAMDLRVGDLVQTFKIGLDAFPLGEVAAKADASSPGQMIQLEVRRGRDRALVALNSTKHDAPALTFFPGADREWVLWMTDGYYETSKAGDRLYLGWHKNPPSDRIDLPTDAFPADKFEAELRRPKVIDRLLDTADVGAALEVLAAPERRPMETIVRMPSAEILEPARPMSGPLVIPAAGLPIRARARQEGLGGITRLSFLVDGRKALDDMPFNPPRPEVDVRVNLDVPSGRHRVSVMAVSDSRKERLEGLDVVYQTPSPRPPRLVVLTVGVDFADRPDGQIEFADVDAEELKTFLSRPGGRERFASVEARAVTGPKATAQGVLGPLEALRSRLKARELGPGDTVLVTLESHLITLRGASALALAETAIPTSDLTDLLGGLAESGCRVMVLLDLVHPGAPGGGTADLDEWVRELYLRRNVIVMVASNQGPGERMDRLRRGAFTQGILTSFDASAQTRLPIDPDGPVTLDDFQTTVTRQVQSLTGRRQHPFCYSPETVSPRLPILDPKESRAGGGS